jgi:uncharacterized membrane protein YedE/YeeE
MSEPTILVSTLGGVAIGVASAAFLLFNGRIAGISGIVGGVIDGPREERPWRTMFLLGLALGGVIAFAWLPAQFGVGGGTSTLRLVIAGLLVGVGTRVGSGCTSGHGVCGIARGSRRSLVATATFMTFAMITVFVTQHILAGAPTP